MLLAVHIADVLPASWCVAGFALAALLIAWSVRGISDVEIPRIALVTAAFFVASLVHVPLGPTSVHLLLNGLVGLLLGRRAPIAIATGLTLQLVLTGHGGFTTLGVNINLLTLPALAVWLLFQFGERGQWTTRPAARGIFVFAGTAVWSLALVVSLDLCLASVHDRLAEWRANPAGWWIARPAVWAGIGLLAALSALVEKRWVERPDFSWGLLLGELAVLLTILGQTVVLALALPRAATSISLLGLLVHLPLAVLEGFMTGIIFSFLRRVAPEQFACGRSRGVGERKEFVERDFPLT